MSWLDAAILATTIVAAILWAVAPRRLLPLLRALALLAGAQVAVEGAYWQFLPLYVLLGLFAVLAVRGRIGRWGRAALALAALTSLSAWAILPVPRLPAPSGPYAVGSVTWRWVDSARAEDATTEPNDRRNVIAQAWYPAAAGAKGPHSIYIDGVGRLPSKVNQLPRFILRHFDRIDTHAIAGAAVSNARATWPVVIFSPGYGAPRAFYTSLVSDLASRGCVVIALDHPYESAVTELADGSIAAPIEHFLPGDPDRIRYMETRIAPRVGDVRFVLDRIEDGRDLGPLAGRLDARRVAAIGHSFGGATSALAMAQDPRLVAGADLDGMLYGRVEQVALGRPFLVIESDHVVTGHPPLYLQRVASLFGRLGARGYRYEIRGVGHLSFTDAEAFFAPPARPVARLALTGSRPAAQARRASADLLDAFLDEALDGAPTRLAATAASHAGVTGGPVRP